MRPCIKSDAVRKRHWLQLMTITGKEFDMDPKMFTLGALFGMDLADFSDEINEMCVSAEKAGPYNPLFGAQPEPFCH